VHQREILRGGGPWIAYSGDTQGRSPKPSETGAKGVLVVEWSGAGGGGGAGGGASDAGGGVGGTITEPEFVPVDVVRFVTCPVDVGEAIDVPALQDIVMGAVEALQAQHEGRPLLARVVLQGRGRVAADLQRDGALDEFVEVLRGACQGYQPFVWIEAVKNQARGELDLDELRRRGDFTAELLKLADGLEADTAATEAFVDRAATKLQSPGQVERALRDLGDEGADPPGEVLAEALQLALDRLETEAAR